MHSKAYPRVPKTLILVEYWQRYWQLRYPSPTFMGPHPAPNLLYKVACRKNLYHNLTVHTTWQCSIRFIYHPVKSNFRCSGCWTNSLFRGPTEISSWTNTTDMWVSWNYTSSVITPTCLPWQSPLSNRTRSSKGTKRNLSDEAAFAVLYIVFSTSLLTHYTI